MLHKAWLVGIIALMGCGVASWPANPPRREAPVASQPELPSPAGDPEALAVVPPTEWRIESIEWDDADSGDINGVRFRLSDIDAPETGGVGAAVGAAECEAERTQGLAARVWIEALTSDPSTLAITATYGVDQMRNPRLLIDLSVNGVDVGQTGIAAGYLAAWPHDGSRALAEKPNWCD